MTWEEIIINGIKDNEMQRGMLQSIYSYLPYSHIDFHIRSTRLNYSAKVKYWKTEPLTNINTQRILSIVKENIENFASADGAVKGFSDEFSENTYSIRAPVISEEGTIFSTIDPLSFFCQKCKRAYTFKAVNDYENKLGVKHDCCRHNLTQIMFTYPCECGYCGSASVLKCDIHPEDDVYFDSNNYCFICSACSGRIEMRERCPECGKFLSPHSALDRANLIAANITLIDLLDSAEERLLSTAEYGNYVIISKWLNKLSDSEYSSIISGEESKNYLIEQDRLKEKTEEHKKLGFGDEMSKALAYADIKSEGLSLIGKMRKFIQSALNTKKKLNKAAGQILEYNRIMRSDNICTLEEAKSITAYIKQDFDSASYELIIQKLGFSNITFSGNIPFLLITYGYTRKSDDPASTQSTNILTLRSFKQHGSDISHLYGVKIETEGILFVLDKKKITEWLISNNVISKISAPDLNNESDLNRWFIDNIDLNGLNRFSKINEADFPATAYVYRLIHSISHALIRKCGICGLDTSSIGEYLLPNIPAFVIYCKDTGGVSIGAISSLFKVHLVDWLMSAYTDIGFCISDPVCIERDKACNGCLLLPNTSCQRQNRDLDRSLICGHITEKERIFGYWNN